MDRIGLCDIYSCTQCHACETACPQNCITFREEKDGFQIPEIDRGMCVECGLCMKSCHQIAHSRAQSVPIRTYAAWTLDDDVRKKSSSGGVFSEVARYVLDLGGIVFGAIMDKELRVRHVAAESLEQLGMMRGSKYVQSDLTGVYRLIKGLLQNGKHVLFTGTPCQVAGLYGYLRKDHEKLLTCDLVCHGVPSQKSFDIYCKKMGFTTPDVTEMGFRYTKGWGYQMSCKRHLVSPTKAEDYKWNPVSPGKSYYLRAFTRALMFSEACYSCRYASPERISDLTLADFWGIGAEFPFDHSVKKGVSLLLVNTEKGQRAVSGCSQLFTEERTLEEALKGNHNLSQCSERPQGRDSYYQDAEQMQPEELMKKYNLQPSWKDYLRPLKRKLL